MTVGERIKRTRLNKQMTLSDLAEKIGSTRQTVFRYESGEIVNIPSDKIEMIAELLDVTPGFLMGWEDNDSNETIIAPTIKNNPRLTAITRKMKNTTPEQQQVIESMLDSWFGEDDE